MSNKLDLPETSVCLYDGYPLQPGQKYFCSPECMTRWRREMAKSSSSEIFKDISKPNSVASSAKWSSSVPQTNNPGSSGGVSFASRQSSGGRGSGGSGSSGSTRSSSASKTSSRSTSHSSTHSVKKGTKNEPTESGKFCQYDYIQIPAKSRRWKYCSDKCRELFYEQERRR